MSVNGWTTGDNFSLMLDLGTGEGFQQPPQNTGFTYNQNLETTSVNAFTTGEQTQSTHRNWSGTIMFVRVDNRFDAFRDAYQAAKLAGTQMPKGTIDTSLRELDGSYTNYQYVDVTFGLAEVSAAPGKDVPERLAWSCATRNKV